MYDNISYFDTIGGITGVFPYQLVEGDRLSCSISLWIIFQDNKMGVFSIVALSRRIFSNSVAIRSFLGHRSFPEIYIGKGALMEFL